MSTTLLELSNTIDTMEPVLWGYLILPGNKVIYRTSKKYLKEVGIMINCLTIGRECGGFAIYWFSKVDLTIHNLKLRQYHTLLALTFPCIVCFCTCWIYFCCLAPFLFFNPKVLSLKWKCISCICSLVYDI